MNRWIGIAMILGGVVLNSWTLGQLFSPDKEIGAIEVRHMIIACQALMVLLGIVVAAGWPRGFKQRMRTGVLFLGCIASIWYGGSEYALWRGWIQPPVRPLDELCDWLTVGNNQYLGRGALEKLSAQIAGSKGEPDESLVRARVELADLELRHGHIGEAIDLLETAAEEAALVGLSPMVHYRITEALGVAFLRRGEVAHCLQQHNGDSCVFPLADGGIWADKTDSLRAIECFSDCLLQEPENITARWLLNLAHMTAGSYPDGLEQHQIIPISVFESDGSIPRFRDIAGELGVDTFNVVGGAITDDIDGDGLIDIVTSTYEPCEGMSYFHNEGEGTFDDWSNRSGLSLVPGGFNLYQADYDNDGRLDILVVRGAWMRRYGRQRSSLLHQNADGSFTDVALEAGLAEIADPNLAAAWADYDNDGLIDVFIGCEDVASGWAGASQLFRNNGDGTFSDVARSAGVLNMRHTKAITWGDYDNDGDPDLFLSNFEDPNRLYRNEGDGTFVDVAPELGLAEVEPENSTFSTWFWDVDNDGWLDLFVGGFGAREPGLVAADYMGLDVDVERMRLYMNDRKGGFKDASREMGVDSVRMPMGANFGDIDNDGWLDMYLGTGAPPYSFLVPNVLYRNVDGQRFQDVTVSAGVGHLQKGHAVAFADLDGDGDQDIYHQLGGFYADDRYSNALYQNPGNDNHWITVRLTGTISNRSAVGARLKAVFVTDGTRREVHRTVGSGGSFGANSFQIELGLAHAERVDELEIRWPTSGIRQKFVNLEVDRVVAISEGDGGLGVQEYDLEQGRESAGAPLGVGTRVSAARRENLRARLRTELGGSYDKPLPTVSEEELLQGAKLWKLLCTSCHGMTGRGTTNLSRMLPVEPPDLSDPASATFFSERAWIKIVTEGSAGTPMAGWNGVLQERDILATVAHMKTLLTGEEQQP